MPRFRNILSSSEQQSQEQHISPPCGNQDLQQLGAGKDCLLARIEDLYWLGARAEIANIVTTLTAWKQSDVLRGARKNGGGALKVPDASEGYDFFLDSVSQWTREYASKNGTSAHQRLADLEMPCAIWLTPVQTR